MYFYSAYITAVLSSISYLSTETEVPGVPFIAPTEYSWLCVINALIMHCNLCCLNDINPHFIPSLLLMILKCKQLLTYCDIIDHKPAANNCDVTMTNCSHVVSMDTFLSQWHWSMCVKEFVKYTSVQSFSSFIVEWIFESMNCLVSDVIINWPSTMCRVQIMALIILQ